MAILERLNNAKIALKELEEESKTLPLEIKEPTIKNLEEIREQINKTASIIEKYFHDKEAFDLMKRELLEKMEEEMVYNGVPSEQRREIAEKIVRNSRLNILDNESFRKYIVNSLRTLDSVRLAQKSYTKKEIIKIGESTLTDKYAGESAKYRKGIDVLVDMIETPKGRKDALARAESRILTDSKMRLYYVYQYYGLLR